MAQRCLARLGLVLCVALASPFVGSSVLAANKRQTVLLFTVYYLNDWVGPLRGHPQTKTPHFERLA
ncbi:MAG: hypothetical protein AAGA03_15845, partial [Planctomycetota bacterium]